MNRFQRRAEVPEADPIYRSLYRVGGIAAALMVLFTILHTAVFFVVGMPDSVHGWFELFERSPLGGLLAFELLLVGYVILSIPLTLALYAALRPSNPSLMSIYLVLALAGAVTFIASRPALEMLSLSNAYTAATTEPQRAAYLAAGEATIAAFDGTAYWASYILGSIGGIVISIVMLQAALFNKTTAYLRLASSVLDFGIFVPIVGLFIAVFSVFCLMGFNTLVARRLLQVARVEQADLERSDSG